MTTAKQNRRPQKQLLSPDEILTISLDTEYTAFPALEDFKAGPGDDLIKFLERAFRKNDVVSYQAHVVAAGGRYDWIAMMKKGKRLTLKTVIESVVQKGMAEGVLQKVPKRIQLVAHWSMPELTSLADYDKIKGHFDGVGRTQASLKGGYKVNFYDKSRNKKTAVVELFDTTLLAPDNARKLASLGELLGIPKVELPEGAIEDMRSFSEQDPKKFEEYALVDARIAAEWFLFCCTFSQELFGESKPPSTLGGIASKLTLQQWLQEGVDRMDVLGKELEEHSDGFTYERVNDVRWYYDHLASAAFYGGRNETFYFGASPRGEWNDFDLSGAYVTAMSMVDTPLWSEAREVRSFDDLSHDAYSAASVEFSFPEETRFPCLPVRAENALIFPLQGKTIASGTEIALARNLGARIKILNGVGYHIPRKSGSRPFGLISKYITDKRAQLSALGLKGSPQEMLYKTIGNSIYGKLSQGITDKRRFDPRSGLTKSLGKSPISMPFIATEVTALIRAVIAEILNNLPQAYMVLSVTTDGFITNAPKEVVEAAAVKGVLGKKFLEARRQLDPAAASFLELKHQVNQVLAWRTRGQATIEPGDGIAIPGVLLAKAGISIPSAHFGDPNEYIIQKFINRHSEDTKDWVERFRSLREIFESGGRVDLNKKVMLITTRMEFDWKRLRSGVAGEFGMRSIRNVDHVYFNTRPLPSLESYKFIRGKWLDFIKRKNSRDAVLMTMEDVVAFESYLGVNPLSGLSVARSGLPQARTLIKMFLRAHVRNLLGLTNNLGNQALAKAMREAGVDVSIADVENAKRTKSIVTFECLYRTPELDGLLAKLQARFPGFDPAALICSQDSPLGYDVNLHSRLSA
ncbi:hypothetical protein OVA24_17465 [Luteolibacter sp. SL250]|uniref:hypothetical protein n=1 Tax=Luteolibacter sp. SL250 TaxID=2995170 RepID=UPI002270AD6F|nr:hypothetical protein [Luteolibacter sp. SL250]WAC19021.1 hypothetical protein OVA24_17465 [Luteolibacter sp. SL250]